MRLENLLFQFIFILLFMTVSVSDFSFVTKLSISWACRSFFCLLILSLYTMYIEFVYCLFICFLFLSIFKSIINNTENFVSLPDIMFCFISSFTNSLSLIFTIQLNNCQLKFYGIHFQMNTINRSVCFSSCHVQQVPFRLKIWIFFYWWQLANLLRKCFLFELQWNIYGFPIIMSRLFNCFSTWLNFNVDFILFPIAICNSKIVIWGPGEPHNILYMIGLLLFFVPLLKAKLRIRAKNICGYQTFHSINQLYDIMTRIIKRTPAEHFVCLIGGQKCQQVRLYSGPQRMTHFDQHHLLLYNCTICILHQFERILAENNVPTYRNRFVIVLLCSNKTTVIDKESKKFKFDRMPYIHWLIEWLQKKKRE